ncbi:MAG: replicative DNA helicase [Oceanicoccus sp.]
MDSDNDNPPNFDNVFDFGFNVDEELAEIKSPPHSIGAEQAVLGGLMIANDSWDNVADQLTADDFFRGKHRQIFTQMGRLVEASEPIDVVTLSEALHNNDLLEQVGGLTYLVELANNTPSAANIRAYARVVRERSSLRSLISVANEIVDSGYSPEGRASDDVLDEAERKIMQISEERPKMGGPQGVTPLLKGAVDRIDELFNSEDTITGVSTGFDDLDEKTSGLQRADLIIVAARPSMGKTAFAVNMVEHAALNQDKPVLVFSMEMPANAIIMRMISAIGRIPLGKVLTGKLDEEDWPKLTSAVSKLKDRPLFIDDTPSLSPTEIRSRTRRIAREHGEVGMIMIDYLQLMQVAGSSEGRTAEISEISRSLKAIAKEFNCPVVALSQLNRSLEQRPNKRPINSDLRESGAIEQDADVIMFIYRDEYYNEDSQDKGIAEIIIGKQRNGPTGTTKLAFIGQFTRFDNLAYSFDEDY